MYHQKLKLDTDFRLESDAVLAELEIAYCTYGKLNTKKNNIVWICHALTANADPSDWWDGLVGPGKKIDPEKDYIICANMLGSPYGSSSPLSIEPETGKPYGSRFPLITTRDMARAHERLAAHLGISEIKMLIGGSMGGHQAVEWAILAPSRFKNLVLLATNARHSAWGIAFNEAQRMALETGENGIAIARAIAMLSYRNHTMYTQTQTDDDDRISDFKAASYQRYQGNKLKQRFNPDCYYSLSKSMDSHHCGRGRTSTENALASIRAKTLVIGISSDLLFPLSEQQFLATHIPNARLEVIYSPYGHDGFLIESEQISQALTRHFPAE